MTAPRARSSSILMPLMTRCMGSRRAGPSTAITTAIVICRFTCSADGVLYESHIRPLTVLSTVPTEGLGALLALLACRLDSLVASIGIILLIGIVAKNAIMVVDFALRRSAKAGARIRGGNYGSILLALSTDLHDNDSGCARSTSTCASRRPGLGIL